MRSAYDYRTASKEAYKDFKKKNRDIKITYLEFKTVIYGFNTMFVEHILETGEKIKIPYGLGQLAINKRKKKKVVKVNGREKINLPIDWVKTREKGKYIYNFNYHTEGFHFRWKWFKYSAKFKYSEYFYFRPSRVNSRLLAHYLKIDEKYQHIYATWLI